MSNLRSSIHQYFIQYLFYILPKYTTLDINFLQHYQIFVNKRLPYNRYPKFRKTLNDQIQHNGYPQCFRTQNPL